MRDLDGKLRARHKVLEEREKRCGLGIPCRDCAPPSPRLPIDVLTMDLVKSGSLRAVSMCPFHAVDTALYYPVWDRVGTRRETDARFRSASRELAKALKTATKVISEALDRANTLLGINPWGWDIRQVEDEPWASVVRSNSVLVAMKRIADAEARVKSGRIGNTRRQSLVEGMLVAWERANGKMPDSGNIRFQEHLLAALTIVEPDYSDFDTVKAIRGALGRIRRRGQKKSTTISKDN
jgi:hypothetical protein